MADDASYSAFLAKANQDPSTNTFSHQSTPQAKSGFDPTTASTSTLPASLQNLDAFYTSDSDEPFEPIALSYAGAGLPSAVDFAKCVKKDEDKVEEVSVQDFDPQGEYGEIINKVKAAGNGDAKVFRIEISKTRAEYYIVSIAERRLVGLRAKAVES